MKRFHVHVVVPDLSKSIDFYSALFAQDPSVRKPEYAKWMLDDPRVNFAISERGTTPGVNHLGFQVDDNAELETLHVRLNKAGETVVAEEGVDCCYAKSDKYWVQDPSGINWENFRSLGEAPTLACDTKPAPAAAAAAAETRSCCAPACCA